MITVKTCELKVLRPSLYEFSAQAIPCKLGFSESEVNLIKLKMKDAITAKKIAEAMMECFKDRTLVVTFTDFLQLGGVSF